MKVCANNLILEVTRRCNQQCAHCMRGHCQGMDMQKEMVDKVLDTFDFICNITFTGGEPSLNIPMICYFFERAEEKGKLPQSFFLATNGLENQEELAGLLLKWYSRMDDKECTSVCVSADDYHETPEFNIMEGLKFYSDAKEYLDPEHVINRGLANENGIGVVNDDQKPIVDLFDEDMNVEVWGNGITFDTVYISANGKMVGDGDLPYEDIDESDVDMENFMEKAAAMYEKQSAVFTEPRFAS